MRVVPRTRGEKTLLLPGPSSPSGRKIRGHRLEQQRDRRHRSEARRGAGGLSAQTHRAGQARTATRRSISAPKNCPTRASAILRVRPRPRWRMTTASMRLPACRCPRRARPSPRRAKPYGFKVELLPIGLVRSSGSAPTRNAEGTMYELRRQTRRAGERDFGPFEFLGTTGKKLHRFDHPRGAASVVYEVTAVRSPSAAGRRFTS